MTIVKIEAIRSDLFARRGRIAASDVLIDDMAQQANKMKVNSYFCLPREFAGRYIKGTINGAGKRQKLSALLRTMNENSNDREWKIRLLRDGHQYAVTCEAKIQKPQSDYKVRRDMGELTVAEMEEELASRKQELADDEPMEDVEFEADDEQADEAMDP